MDISSLVLNHVLLRKDLSYKNYNELQITDKVLVDTSVRVQGKLKSLPGFSKVSTLILVRHGPARFLFVFDNDFKRE